MKRYDLAAECGRCGSLTKDLTESPIGDWVSYEDHIEDAALLLKALEHCSSTLLVLFENDLYREDHPWIGESYALAKKAIDKARGDIKLETTRCPPEGEDAEEDYFTGGGNY